VPLASKPLDEGANLPAYWLGAQSAILAVVLAHAARVCPARSLTSVSLGVSVLLRAGRMSCVACDGPEPGGVGCRV
jgi:hypothetical protein